MKIAVLAVLALGMMACSKEEAPTGAAAGQGAAAKPEAKTDGKPAEAKPAEAKPAEAPKSAGGGFKGIDGKEIVGYLKDPKDDGVCIVLTAKSKEEAATLTKEKVEELAKMMKAEVTDKCSTDGVVGSCFTMGMLGNYYGPKYTKDTAKAACDKDHGKWFE